MEHFPCTLLVVGWPLDKTIENQNELLTIYRFFIQYIIMQKVIKAFYLRMSITRIPILCV